MAMPIGLSTERDVAVAFDSIGIGLQAIPSCGIILDGMPIRSFADKATEEFFFTGKPGRKTGWSAVAETARRKLDMLHFATELRDLQSPPGNRLEALRGDLKGLHSIRVNDRWRIVFAWADHGAGDVRISDYH